MHSSLLPLLGLVLVGLVILSWLILHLRRMLELRRLRRRRARGARGQKRARRYLERRGYTVLTEEETIPGWMLVDGERVDYNVRIDYLVAKRGKVFGVEVKTGNKAINPRYRATRRQLLEYLQLLPIDGLYLLDMETPRMMQVCFPLRNRRSVQGSQRWVLLLGFLLGVGIAVLFHSEIEGLLRVWQ